MTEQVDATRQDAMRQGPTPVLPDDGRTSRRLRWLVFALLLLAFLIRLPAVVQNLPFSYHGDELHFMKRSMAIGSGDLNPHWFHKPAFLMYLLTFCYGCFYAVGAAVGSFASAESFGAYFLGNQGPFLLIGRLLICAFGIGTTYLTYRLCRSITRSATLGLLAGLIAAVLPSTVASSTWIKADVPSGFFLLAAILVYRHSRDDDRWRWLVAAAALAGVSMGTKYYGIVLLPVFGLLELARHWTREAPWREALARGAVAGLVFLAAFFVVSPFHFLDPAWGRAIAEQLAPWFGGGGAETAYTPDNQVRYEPGLGAVPGAVLHFALKVGTLRALGPLLTLLAVAGTIWFLRRRETRWDGVLLVAPVLIFSALAVTFGAYHANARHLNGVYPLLAILAVGGADAASRGLARWTGHRQAVCVALVLVALVPSTWTSIADVAARSRTDSRTVAYRWIVEHLPPDAAVLLDDHGPTLQPNGTSIARLEERLADVPRGEAFTAHQAVRLRLLKAYPPEHTYDTIELAHPWWSDRELSTEEIADSWTHRDMGNPLVDRIPRSLDWYREQGMRYVITNTKAQSRYREGSAERDAFPTFARFYDEVAALPLVARFDPAEWNGTGPVVFVYRLAPDDAGGN